MGLSLVVVENWAVSSECFDAELDRTGMLSSSFYVVPHNKSGSTAPRTATREAASRLSFFLHEGLVSRSIFMCGDGDTHILNLVS